MKKIAYVIIFFLTIQCFSQISGKVTDGKTGLPIEFVNIWIKNTLRGTTTNLDGLFKMENAKIGDTLLISNLGYEELELIAITDNQLVLNPKEIELDEVILVSMKGLNINEINSYKKLSQIKEFYFNGHYSLARNYSYKTEYKNNPFIKKISLVTLSALKTKVTFRIHLIYADVNGEPTNRALSEYYILECGKGKKEIALDLQNEKILIPEEGFFVVVDRLNLEQNKFSNKLAKNILQPAIGIEKEEQEMNTWLGFSGKWISPSQFRDFIGKYKNIAINIELTD